MVGRNKKYQTVAQICMCWFILELGVSNLVQSKGTVNSDATGIKIQV